MTGENLITKIVPIAIVVGGLVVGAGAIPFDGGSHATDDPATDGPPADGPPDTRTTGETGTESNDGRRLDDGNGGDTEKRRDRRVDVDAPFTDVETGPNRTRVDVDAPFADVDTRVEDNRTRVDVDTPFAGVDTRVENDRTRVDVDVPADNDSMDRAD